MLTSIFPMGGSGQLPFVAIVSVQTDADATVTCTNGSLTYTSDRPETTHVFKLLAAGEWTVTARRGQEESSKTVSVEQDGQFVQVDLRIVHIYGIERSVSAPSPLWTRTDQATGKTATASVGTIPGSSDFDACMPWAGMQRETLSTGDVMVKIPKFYFQRTRQGEVERIRIADQAAEGFSVHPAFCHAGVETDFVYVGAYKTSSGNRSVSGALPQGSQSMSSMRDSARGKGSGWGLLDASVMSAIQMLILVEFASNDVQDRIGSGYCSGEEQLATGTCDTVPRLTGRPSGGFGAVDAVWRGIEGLWGNAWEYVDGINWQDGGYYVCNDPSLYASDTQNGYEKLSYNGQTGWELSYITQVGYDPPARAPDASHRRRTGKQCNPLL